MTEKGKHTDCESVDGGAVECHFIVRGDKSQRQH